MRQKYKPSTLTIIQNINNKGGASLPHKPKKMKHLNQILVPRINGTLDGVAFSMVKAYKSKKHTGNPFPIAIQEVGKVLEGRTISPTLYCKLLDFYGLKWNIVVEEGLENG